MFKLSQNTVMRNAILFTIFWFSFACKSEMESKQNELSSFSKQDLGTLAMRDSLDNIYSRVDFKGHPYENIKNLVIMEDEIAKNLIKISPQSYMDYATLLMKSGKNDKAIKVINNIFEFAPELSKLNDNSKEVFELLAIIHLRKGEIDNCVLNHNEESCLFPIKGKAIHTDQTGSKGAIEIYNKILESYPNDYQSRWLINIAYMTLNEYPDGVPSQYLITPKQLEDDVQFPEFTNMAMSTGTDINELSGSSIMEDFDNDGDLDLVASSWGLKGQLRYFVNQEGKLVQQTEQAGLEGLYGGLNIKQTDYNNDGYIDIFVIRGAWRVGIDNDIYPNSLLKNNGDGSFSDVTIESGLYQIAPSQAVVWTDIDNDGWLDLYIANESIPSKKYPQYPNQLYVNNQDGTFLEVADRLNIGLKGFFKGVVATDYDNDGDQDIYLSNLASENLLIHNMLKETGQLSFENRTSKANIAEPIQAFPCWFFDYNNDGWEDLYVSAYSDFLDSGQTAAVAKSYLGLNKSTDGPRFYHNNGDGTFSNKATELGLNLALHTMGCNYGDINNDGYLDFYLGTGAPDYRSIVPNRLFINQKAKSFADVTTSANVGNIQKGHGISISDIDNDGDQDIYAVMGGAYSGDFFQNALFVNPGNENNWVRIKLVGTTTNKPAIGSKIKLTITENGIQRNIYRTVSSGASFGANSLMQDIGIGNTLSIDKLEVQWANGSINYVDYGSQDIKKLIVVTEGIKEVQVENVTALKLSGEKTHQHHNH